MGACSPSSITRNTESIRMKPGALDGQMRNTGCREGVPQFEQVRASGVMRRGREEIGAEELGLPGI